MIMICKSANLTSSTCRLFSLQLLTYQVGGSWQPWARLPTGNGKPGGVVAGEEMAPGGWCCLFQSPLSPTYGVLLLFPILHSQVFSFPFRHDQYRDRKHFLIPHILSTFRTVLEVTQNTLIQTLFSL